MYFFSFCFEFYKVLNKNDFTLSLFAKINYIVMLKSLIIKIFKVKKLFYKQKNTIYKMSNIKYSHKFALFLKKIIFIKTRQVNCKYNKNFTKFERIFLTKRY